MPSQAPHPLLSKAPPGRHFAQFHKDSRSLAGAVTQFVEAGLRRQDGVVVIASPAHAQVFLARLRERALDVDASLAAGRLVILDAGALLNRFMRPTGPDWSDFRQAIGAVFDRVQASHPRSVRVYGEMVDILWREKAPEAAIQIEEYWNRLATEYSFALFCCYTLEALAEDSYAGPLDEIGRTHSDILWSEEDEHVRSAVDAATNDIFGSSLSHILSSSGQEDHDGEHRLPLGQRTLLWIKRNLPASCGTILGRARSHYHRQSLIK